MIQNNTNRNQAIKNSRFRMNITEMRKKQRDIFF